MILLTKEEIKYIQEEEIELTEAEEVQYIYSRWYYDIEFFWSFFLSHWKSKKTPEFHKEISKVLRSPENTCVICPRWHGKTTTILIDIIHSLVYKIYWSQLYIAAAWLWSESLWKIKHELETNEDIKRVFWKLVPRQDRKTQELIWTKKWKERMLELTNGESIETLSKGNPVRWKRPKRIVVDDIDENKDVMTKTVVEKTRNWFFSSLYNTLLPWGKIVILWTIVGNMCMVKYIKETKNWHIIEYKAINNWKALWEDMWSLEELEKRKRAIGSTLFNQEFMNIPIQAENSIVKEEHIQYFKHNNKIIYEYINIWIDPAISEKTTSDPFAIVVTGEIGTKKYILEAKQLEWAKKDPFKATKIVKFLYDKWNANAVNVETIAFQQVMAKLFKMHNISTNTITPNKDKVTRLMEWQWDFEQWEIYFNKSLTYDLVEQLIMFPDVEHDDLVDAMVYSFRKKKKKFYISSI